MSLPVKKSAQPVPTTPGRRKVLVALCALFTIAVPLAIIAAVVLPHLGNDDSPTAPDAPTAAPSPTTVAVSATTPAASSPTAPVSGTAQ